MTDTFVQQCRAALAPLADPERAAPMRAYMQDRFPFLGIGMPQRRAALRPALARAKGLDAEALLGAADRLWSWPEREYHYAAIDLLTRYQKKLHASDLPALLALVRRHAWWDSVDALAAVIGAVVRREPSAQAVMDACLRDPDLWVRRVAMLHQKGWKADTDTARLFAYARTLAPETDFFIRKAIGWALRDYAWHDPEAVRAFLAAEKDTLSGLTLREAGKHL